MICFHKPNILKMSYFWKRFKKMNLRYLIFLCFFGLFSCEKDDICLEGTPGTPRMIVLFKDYQNPSVLKAVSDLTIKGFDQETAFAVFSGDSVAIPLKNNFKFTQYELLLGTEDEVPIADSLQINYRQFDLYINRACGYKSNFIFEDGYNRTNIAGVLFRFRIKTWCP